MIQESDKHSPHNKNKSPKMKRSKSLKRKKYLCPGERSRVFKEKKKKKKTVGFENAGIRLNKILLMAFCSNYSAIVFSLESIEASLRGYYLSWSRLLQYKVDKIRLAT